MKRAHVPEIPPKQTPRRGGKLCAVSVQEKKEPLPVGHTATATDRAAEEATAMGGREAYTPVSS